MVERKQDITSRITGRRPVGPNALEVQEAHRNSDLDSSYHAQHHTIGTKAHQAAAGDHEHRLIGIWLYKDADGLHNSPGNWQALGFSDFVFWDQEYYKKVSSTEIEVIKGHTAMIMSAVSFDFNAGGGRRGVRWLRTGTPEGTMEVASIAAAGVPTRVVKNDFGIDLVIGNVISAETFQASGANVAINQQRHSTHLKIIRMHPDKFDVASLTAGGIVPQIPGPEIASRKFLINGAW